MEQWSLRAWLVRYLTKQPQEMMAFLVCKFSFTTSLIDSYSHQLHNSLLTKVAFSFSIQYSVLALPKQRWLSSLYWARLPISSTDLVAVLRARVLLLVSKYMRKYPTRIFKAAFYYITWICQRANGRILGKHCTLIYNAVCRCECV